MRGPEIIDPTMNAEWDDFVRSHPFGQIYHLTSWKSLLERSYKHIRGRIYVLRDDEENRIQAGLPVYRVRSWLTGTRLVCAPFATLFDPLVSNRSQMDQLSMALLEDARKLRCSYIEIRTYKAGQYLEDSGYAESKFYKNHSLRLDSPPEQLRLGFHRTCVRQRIARAEASGLELRIAEQYSDLRIFYSLLSKTRMRLGLPPHPFAFFEALWDEFRPMDLISVFIAQKDGRPIAAIMLLTFKDRVSVEFSAIDESFKQYSPTHFLFWEAIKWASGRGFQVIDFGRTSPNNTSLMEFKERWGTECVDLPQFFHPIGCRRDGRLKGR